jgi:hypothetical protein
MFGSAVLDVAIGITFIYIVWSLACTQINEWIARLMAMRANTLEDGIRHILNDPKGDGLAKVFYKHPLICALSPKNEGLAWPGRGGKPSYISAENFATTLADIIAPPGSPQPSTAKEMGDRLVKLADPAMRGKLDEAIGTAGASISAARKALQEKADSLAADDALAQHLAIGLLDLVAPEDRAEPEALASARKAVEQIAHPRLQRLLLGLIGTAEADLVSARRTIETWFDDSMDRVSGWYKRKTQWIIWWVGVCLALLLNADTISLANSLWNDQPLRQAVVAAALAINQAPRPTQTPDNQPPPRPDEAINTARTQLAGLQLPIGWCETTDQKAGTRQLPVLGSVTSSLPTCVSDPATPANAGQDNSVTPRLDGRRIPIHFLDFMVKVLGLFLTAVALSLGAPFWFDTLSRLANLRSAGDPPRKATDDSNAR